MKATDNITPENVNAFLKSKPVKIILIAGGTVLTIIVLTHALRIIANLVLESKNLISAIKE